MKAKKYLNLKIIHDYWRFSNVPKIVNKVRCKIHYQILYRYTVQIKIEPIRYFFNLSKILWEKNMNKSFK